MNDLDRALLAGLVIARGSFYIGRSQRAAVFRYSPGLIVEISLTHPLLAETMGEPKKRAYYGRVVYRYCVQDRESIVKMVQMVQEFLPEPLARKAALLAAFCVRPTPENYTEFTSIT